MLIQNQSQIQTRKKYPEQHKKDLGFAVVIVVQIGKIVKCL